MRMDKALRNNPFVKRNPGSGVESLLELGNPAQVEICTAEDNLHIRNNESAKGN